MEITTTVEEPRAPGLWGGFVGALEHIGFSPLGLGLVIVLAILPLVYPFSQEHILRWMIMGAFLAAQAAAFDFTAGYINVVNFGFAAILGLGAYTSAILANTSPVLALQPGISPWIGIWVGAILAGVVGFGLGILTLRLRGISRGPLGMAPRSFLETTSNRPYFYIILAMMLVVYITLRLVTRSHFGLAFKAIGQNFDAARASGINPTYYRVLNFTLSAFFAGWLGGFYAHYFGSLTPQTLMHTSKTVEVLAIAYIGGRGSLWGGMAIAFPFVFFIEFLRSNLTELPGLHLVIYGVLMILVMIYYPAGLAGVYQWLAARIKAFRSERQEQR
jgi:branched-chain amino acid transport system permease protein